MLDVNNAGIRFFLTMNRIRRAWVGVVPSGRLSKSQFVTLFVLRNGKRGPFMLQESAPSKPMTLSHLARELNQSMPAISQQITRLENMGYVRRNPSKTDRRTILIELTPEGAALLDDSRKQMQRRMNAMIGHMGEQEFIDMMDMMDRLVVVLEESSHTIPGE